MKERTRYGSSFGKTGGGPGQNSGQTITDIIESIQGLQKSLDNLRKNIDDPSIQMKLKKFKLKK